MENSINIFIVQKSGTNIWQAQQNSDVYVRLSWKNLSFEKFCWNWPLWPDNFHFCGKGHLFLVFGKGVQKNTYFCQGNYNGIKVKISNRFILWVKSLHCKPPSKLSGIPRILEDINWWWMVAKDIRVTWTSTGVWQ